MKHDPLCHSVLGHPVLRAGYCAVVNVTDGRWRSRFCSEKKPYVCQLSSALKIDRSVEASIRQNVPKSLLESLEDKAESKEVVPDLMPAPKRCPSEWTYVAVQGKCLRVGNA